MENYTSFQLTLYALIAANVILSFVCFNDRSKFDRLKFRVHDILVKKEWYRLFSSGFLHGNLPHIFFNMFALYTFGLWMESSLNVWEFSTLYVVSLLVGNLLPLYFYRHNPNYSAVGASGAVSGIIYASVLFYPEGTIYLLFFPIKRWIFGILYLLYTIYGIRKQGDNIGHEAHLGGAIMGILLAFVFKPESVQENWWVAVLLLVPTLIFFIVALKKPEWLQPNSSFKFKNIGTARSKRSVDDLYKNDAWEREKELNFLLEKIKRTGLESLSKYERNRLEELSK